MAEARRVLVTGVNGFIGAYFTRWLLDHNPLVEITGLNRKSSERNELRLGDARRDPRFRMIYGDIADPSTTSGLCENVDVVVNFAAKTFVDHSIKDDETFYRSNVVGARNLMLDAERYDVARFVQVSTDEVYGQILEGRHTEESTLHPRNPYAATKAAADCLAIAKFHTVELPVIITRTENNFGPWQDPQKAMPKFVRCALAGDPLPVYGDGLHVRCWLHVEEHCRAIWHLVGHGTSGEVYNVAGEQELTNLALARRVCDLTGASRSLITHIEDRDVRPGHDRRYALDVTKLRRTGWKPSGVPLDDALELTIDWYARNLWWLR